MRKLRADLDLLSVRIYRNVDKISRSDSHYLAFASKAFSFYFNVYRYRCIPNFYGASVKADEVADENRFVKNDLIHRHGHKPFMLCMPHGLYAAGDVNIAQNDPAKNGAVSISVPWHHRQSDSGISSGFVLDI
jgi:hypothetical protein